MDVLLATISTQEDNRDQLASSATFAVFRPLGDGADWRAPSLANRIAWKSMETIAAVVKW